MNIELLQRYVEGDISDEDATRVVEWLEGDESHVREYIALHKLHDLSLMNPPRVKPPAGKLGRMRKTLIEIAKAAAAVVAVLVVGYLVTTTNSQEEDPSAMQTLYVPAGQRARLELPDGTKIWMNAKSTLTYPANFGGDRREVTLDGEALFDVEADEHRPFLVNIEKMKLVVTGTEFNVSSYGGSGVSDIALLEGEVALYSPADETLLYRMNPSDLVRFSGDRLQVSTITNYDYFRWSEGLICFSNETVRDIFAKLELYFDITLDVERETLLNYRYTGKFRTKDGIEQVLRTIQLEHRFRYEKDMANNRIIIK